MAKLVDLVDGALDRAEEKYLAGTGPGGQNVNRNATTVQLRLDAAALGLAPDVLARLAAIAGSRMTREGEIVLTAREYRSRAKNREAARARLRAMMEQALKAPRKRASSRVNRLGKVKRLKAKKNRSAIKANRAKPRG